MEDLVGRMLSMAQNKAEIDEWRMRPPIPGIGLYGRNIIKIREEEFKQIADSLLLLGFKERGGITPENAPYSGPRALFLDRLTWKRPVWETSSSDG